MPVTDRSRHANSRKRQDAADKGEPHAEPTESDAATIAELAAEARHCKRCPLYKNATQLVFGEGPEDASMVLVGEQPGDEEDKMGRPFVGPAGRLLDRALAEAGLAREAIYLTNVVKHFKHEQRGKRRLHKRPNQFEIERCRWWLDRELTIIKPKLVVTLGVTATAALVGRTVVLSRLRGQVLSFGNGRAGMATIHPSAILRMPDQQARHQAFDELVRDLKRAVKVAGMSAA
jgi:uracil-DNA glycosylase family protein